MPTHDFVDIGDVLDFELLRGTITAIDSDSDTCAVDVVNGQSIGRALLFYHCTPQSLLRADGGIEGAARGFKVDDDVIVLIKKDSQVVKVIGHIDGIRSCSMELRFKFNILYSDYDYFYSSVYRIIDELGDTETLLEKSVDTKPLVPSSIIMQKDIDLKSYNEIAETLFSLYVQSQNYIDNGQVYFTIKDLVGEYDYTSETVTVGSDIPGYTHTRVGIFSGPTEAAVIQEAQAAVAYAIEQHNNNPYYSASYTVYAVVGSTSFQIGTNITTYTSSTDPPEDIIERQSTHYSSESWPAGTEADHPLYPATDSGWGWWDAYTFMRTTSTTFYNYYQSHYYQGDFIEIGIPHTITDTVTRAVIKKVESYNIGDIPK